MFQRIRNLQPEKINIFLDDILPWFIFTISSQDWNLKMRGHWLIYKRLIVVCYRLIIPYPKCLKPEQLRISECCICIYIEIPWVPNLSTRSIYVSFTAYNTNTVIVKSWLMLSVVDIFLCLIIWSILIDWLRLVC